MGSKSRLLPSDITRLIRLKTDASIKSSDTSSLTPAASRHSIISNIPRGITSGQYALITQFFGGPRRPIFTPTSIGGLALWLDAADSGNVIRSGSNVTQWTDKSGNGANATPIAGSPTYTNNLQNGLPGIVFNSNMLICPAFLTSTNFSIFIVTKDISNSPLGVWKRKFSSGVFIASDVMFVSVNKTGDFARDAEIGLSPTSNARILCCSLTSSITAGSSFTFNASINGTNTTITGTSTNGNADFCNELVGIGGVPEAPDAPTFQLVGNIHEVIVITTTVTTGQRQQIEGYLAWKWGLQASLPSDHPYRKAAP